MKWIWTDVKNRQRGILYWGGFPVARLAEKETLLVWKSYFCWLDEWNCDTDVEVWKTTVDG